jgi:hypothetical protein
MKLFASRKRKVEPPPLKEERTVFQSDPVVEELLQKDPSTWNAKQRRMIQRYRERKTEKEGNDASDTVTVELQQQSSDEVVVDNDGKQLIHGDVDDDAKSTSENTNNENTDRNIKLESNNDPSTTDSNPSKAEKDAELDTLFEKLSSKQRRTLTRLLERTGDTAAVKEEAGKMLEEKEPSTQKNETVVTEEPPSKRRRKSSVNWDSLTPEERMRREEQKRLQKEAAERRARGGELSQGQHRHPLNSERRRANRRKPKYDNTRNKVKLNNEHNTSGFSVRKSAGKK